jgi:hypothetical protein
MTTTIKLKGSESYCNTVANTFGNSHVVRLLNINTAPWLITHANTSGTVGTITINNGQEFFVEKQPTDTLASNTASNYIVAVPVSFRQ